MPVTLGTKVPSAPLRAAGAEDFRGTGSDPVRSFSTGLKVNVGSAAGGKTLIFRARQGPKMSKIECKMNVVKDFFVP